MTSYLKRAPIMVFAIMLAGFFSCPTAVQANVLVNVAQGFFAPVAQDGATRAAQATPPSSAATASGFDIKSQPAAIRYEANKIYTGEKISLDFQNAELHSIIRIIGEVSGKNIVVSDDVTGKVTLKLKDVPWDQALDIVLASRNLGVEEDGNVLAVYDLPSLQAKHAGQERIAAERVAAMAIAPLSKTVFTPKYAPISNVKAELDKIKTSRGKIESIGNDLYIEDDPSSISTMRQILMRIDRVAKQILIEARIIEASSSFSNSLGVKWGAKYNDSSSTGGGNSGEASGSVALQSGTAALGLGFINKANSLRLNAELEAKESSSETRTLSAPRIMAANDQKVSIKQGQQVPYSSGSSANTAANVQFKEVVMELEVTPHIEENGQIITLEIKLTNDTLATSSGSSEPAINTKEAETMLMVKDGETVVIGGIIVDTQSNTSGRVPGIHRIPILGWLFQDRDVTNSKNELLIFITANIIPVNI